MKRKKTLKTGFIVSLLALGVFVFIFGNPNSHGEKLFQHGAIADWIFVSILLICFGLPLFLGTKKIVKWLITPKIKASSKLISVLIRSIVVLVIFFLCEAAADAWSADNSDKLSDLPYEPLDVIIFIIMYNGFGTILYALGRLLYRNKAPLSALTINNVIGKVATSVLLILLGWIAFVNSEIGWIGVYKFFSQIGPFAILLLIIMIVGFGTPLLFWGKLITRHFRKTVENQSSNL